MKILVPAMVIGLLLMTPLVNAFSGFYGHTYDRYDNIAPFATITFKDGTSPDTTLYSDANGYYSCPRAGSCYYYARARKSGYEDAMTAWCSGQQGGDQLDFYMDTFITE